MSIRMHRILMHVIYPLGMVGGFFCFAFGCSAVTRSLDLPAPLSSTSEGIAMIILIIALFPAFVYGGGMVAVLVVQRWVKGQCTKCGQEAVCFHFMTDERRSCVCAACGESYLTQGDKKSR